MKFLLLLALSACAADPYRKAVTDCVLNAKTEAESDACRAKLQLHDAGTDHG